MASFSFLPGRDRDRQAHRRSICNEKKNRPVTYFFRTKKEERSVPGNIKLAANTMRMDMHNESNDDQRATKNCLASDMLGHGCLSGPFDCSIVHVSDIGCSAEVRAEEEEGGKHLKSD